MDSQIILSPFPTSCDHASHIETLVCTRNPSVNSITICQYCKSFHMSSEECGDIPIKMSEIVSVDAAPPLRHLPSLLQSSINPDIIPEISTERSTIVMQTFASDGLDGTGGRPNRDLALSKVTTSGNRTSLGTPLCKTTSRFWVSTFG